MSYETLEIEWPETGLATITLNRPERMNAWNQQLMLDLRDVIDGLTEVGSQARVVLVHGRGRAFGAGGDMELFAKERDRKLAAQRVDAVQAVFRRIQTGPQLFVAAIHGYCVGSSLVLAGCCDLRFASHDARFLLPEIDMGMLPGIGIGHVSHVLGERMLRHLLYTGRPFTAQQADRDGFVTLIEPDEDVLDVAIAHCRLLLEKPAEALAAAKRIVRLASTQGSQASIEEELTLNAKLLSGAAVRDRARAFLSPRTSDH